LGLDAAKLLVRLNCSTLVLACRSIAKGEQAKQEILASLPESTHPTPNIVTFALDLSSFQSVVDFTESCKTLPRLDAAILSAGVFLVDFTITEGFETTIAINVVSTFLLATLLLPQLRSTARNNRVTTTIAIVGSAVHAFANPKDLTTPPNGQILSTLSDPKQAKMKDRYYLSKLPVMLLVRHLSKKLEISAASNSTQQPLVAINNVAPGLCKTNLFRNDMRFVTRVVLKILARTSEQGARTLVHGAIAGKESNGQYLSECQVKEASAFVSSAQGDATAERIWKELVSVYEKVKPGCTNVW
jgi:retinol dehydrogenase 12